MSRVGKKPITIPSGVTVTINDAELDVKGPKGTLKTPIPAGIKFKQEDGSLIAERENDDKAAFHERYGCGRRWLQSRCAE
jgi:large subunit ribosomal protein L6